MIPFNIKQLETFLWVATLGSFRKAAARLNTTQPAVSSRIAGLEDALGVKLFERVSGTVRLTAKGQQLLPHAQRLLRTADRLQMAANSLAGVKGVLRLGVAETIVHTWLSEFLKEFHETYPLIDVDVIVDVTVNLRNELIARRIDLAILMGPVSEYRIENLEMPSFPLAWVCAPGLPLATSRVRLADLMGFPIITYARTTRPYIELYRKFSSEFEEAPRMFPANSLAASLKMVMDGIGIGALPMDVICPHLERGDLRIVDCEWTPADLQFTASFPVEPPNPIVEQAARLAARVAEAHAKSRCPTTASSEAGGFTLAQPDHTGK